MQSKNFLKISTYYTMADILFSICIITTEIQGIDTFISLCLSM